MNVLIATVTAGAGHLQAAAALEEAWRAARPRDTVQRLDVLEFTPKLYRRAYVEGYVKLVAHAPELWGLVFDKTDNPTLLRKLSRLRRALAKFTAPRFTRQVRRFQPEAVLCTHYLPLEILGRMRAESAAAPTPFVASVVTDFEAHALWLEPCVGLYCVAAEETGARLVARGVLPDRVVATGIPIAQKFSQAVNVADARRRAGLRDDSPVLLVLSGGFGLGPVRQVLAALNQFDRPVQVVVVCGRNAGLRRELAELDHRHPTRVLGFVDHMHELMTAADLILTKPGGLTTSEALALGRPLLVLNPIPGQEAANSDFLLEHGAAAKVSRPEDLPFRLPQLLDPARLATMAAAARALGRPQAAAQVCREVVQRLKG
jgi:processive 1,2-diacylglycerol beta-glucosyltransferase